MEDLVRTAAAVTHTRAEGPHLRFALWLQGCSVRCPGCCNPEMFDASLGQQSSVRALLGDIETAQRSFDIEGVTLLGGEPTDQLLGVTVLAEQTAKLGLGVIVFSGRTLGELRAMPGFDRLAAATDTLVDGRFDGRLREPANGRRFIGSTNQSLRHFSPRYADPELWRGPSRIEAHIAADGSVRVHGFPAPTRALIAALERPRADAVSEAHGQERQADAGVLADEVGARRVLDR